MAKLPSVSDHQLIGLSYSTLLEALWIRIAISLGKMNISERDVPNIYLNFETERIATGSASNPLDA